MLLNSCGNAHNLARALEQPKGFSDSMLCVHEPDQLAAAAVYTAW